MFALGTLEISFIVLLVGMLGLSMLIGAYVIVKVIEPRGLKAFIQNLTGRRTPADR